MTSDDAPRAQDEPVPEAGGAIGGRADPITRTERIRPDVPIGGDDDEPDREPAAPSSGPRRSTSALGADSEAGRLEGSAAGGGAADRPDEGPEVRDEPQGGTGAGGGAGMGARS